MSLCPYCNFFSLIKNVNATGQYFDDNQLFQLYKSQLNYYYNFSSDSIVQTIFFGGGTPSLSGINFLSDIIEYIYRKWHITKNPEISIEVNPSSSDQMKFSNYKQIGINRLSIGVQSLNDDELKFLGRIHSSKIALNAISYAVKYFNNVSVDFMYGLPNHNLEVWDNRLNEIANLNLPHYSLYQLTIEQGTPFHKFVKKGKFVPANDELQARLFCKTRKFMRKNKIYPYEISNFAKPGFTCKHNLAYWTNQNYIGIGPSAQSRIDNFAFVNSQTDWNKIKMEKLSQYEKSEEIILTNLRSKYGLKLTNYLVDILDFDVINNLSDYVKYNKQKNTLKMTEKGFLYFNTVIEKILR